MKNNTWLLLAVMLLTTPVIKAQTPLQLNDDLAGITDSLYLKGQYWGVKFNEAFKNHDYSILKPLSSDLLAYVNLKLIYVEKMKDVKNSKPLRIAILELLKFEKLMVTGGFQPFETFDADTPVEKVRTALDNLTAKAKDEDVYLKAIQSAQDVYAAENGFKIKSDQK